MKDTKWVVVVFEGKYREFPGEVAYVKGPFPRYEDAMSWAEKSKDCPLGEFQITFIDAVVKPEGE